MKPHFRKIFLMAAYGAEREALGKEGIGNMSYVEGC